TTRFGPGPSLSIPLRVKLAPSAYLRTTLRADMGVGSDQVSWDARVGSEDLRLSANDHWAMMTAASLTVGLEGRVSEEWAVQPLGGVAAGLAWVGTWHSFGPSEGGYDTTFLLDPSQGNDLSDPNNRDPYATAFTPMVDVHVGLAAPLSDKVEAIGEIGYSVAFLSDTELVKAPPALNVRRDAFGWNALRVQVGASFSF
ncbi:MAG: hypothetical protein AB8H79_26780, partial [Myxococcota bacterium]